MSDDVSPRLRLPFLAAGQAQKEIWVNEALQRIDALIQPVAESADLSGPPASPTLGLCWIVARPATGEWAGHEDGIAQWTAGGWRFAAPSEGWECHVRDRDAALCYREGLWREDAVRPDGLYIDGVKVVGSRMAAVADPSGGTIIDSQARATINALLGVLRAHGLIAS